MSENSAATTDLVKAKSVSLCIGFVAAFVTNLSATSLTVLSAVLHRRGVPALQCSLSLSAGSLGSLLANIHLTENGHELFAEVCAFLSFRNGCSVSDWLWFVVSACTCELQYFLAIVAAHYIPSGDVWTINSVMCLLFSPICVLLAIGDGPPRGFWLSASLCAVGVTLVNRPSFLVAGHSLQPLGVVFSTLSAVSVFKEVGIQKLAKRRFDSNVLTQSRLFIGGITMLFVFALCTLWMPRKEVWTDPFSLKASTLFLLFCMAPIYGIIPMGGTVMTVALGANICAVIGQSVIPMSVVLEMIILGTVEPPIAYVGMAIACVGALVSPLLHFWRHDADDDNQSEDFELLLPHKV